MHSRELPSAHSPLPARALQDLLACLRRWDYERAQAHAKALRPLARAEQQAVLDALLLTLRRISPTLVSAHAEDIGAVLDALRQIEHLDSGEYAGVRDWMFSAVGVRIGAIGGIEISMRWLDRAIQGSRQRGDMVQWRRSLSNKASVLMLSGALEQAEALNLEALALMPEGDEDRPTVLNNMASAIILRARELPEADVPRRRALGEQALARAREALSQVYEQPPRHPWYPGWIMANIGHALRLVGQPEAAQQAYEQALALTQDNPRIQVDVMANRGALLAEQGQAEAARVWIDRAAALASDDLLAPAQDLILETRIRVEALSGRHAQALQWAEQRWRRLKERYDLRLRNALSDDLQRELEQARRAEHEAQARAQALDAASAAKSSFVAHMSHEIRTPIHAILGLAQLLHEQPLPDQLTEKVQGILEAGDSLLHIVNDILDLSKIEAGQMPLQREPMSVPDVLRRVERLLRPGAQAKGLTMSVEADDRLQAALMGDAPKLEQVLVNLVSNAIKFTGKGEVRVRATAQSASAGSLKLRLEVQDTGVGIPPAALERLFTPFTQADARINRQFGGTGLGLAISRRLVDLMGGRIGAVSVPGQGSTFWCAITLDLAPEPTLPAPLEEARPAPSRGDRLQGLRVLAVDDNRLNRLVIQRQLQREGVQVQLAEDGVQALEMLRARPEAFDVVLMDVQMPALDGLSATRAMRADPALAQLPVIALTAGVLAQDEDAARAAGMNDFIAKPVDLERLVEALKPYRPGSGPAH